MSDQPPQTPPDPNAAPAWSPPPTPTGWEAPAGPGSGPEPGAYPSPAAPAPAASPQPGAPSPGAYAPPGSYPAPGFPQPAYPQPGQPGPGGYPQAGQYPASGFPAAGGPGWMPGGPVTPPPGRRLGTGGVIGIIVGAIVVIVVLLIGAVTLLGKSTKQSDTTAPLFDGSATTEVVSASTEPTTSAPTPVTVPAVPSGYQLIGSSAAGFAFVIPSTWTSTSLSPDELSKEAAALDQSDPQAAASIRQFAATLAAGGGNGPKGLAFAYGPTTGSLPGSIELLKVPVLGVTPAQLIAQLELGLGAVNGKAVSQRVLQLSGFPAAEVNVQLTVNAPTGVVHPTETLVAVEAKSGSYVMVIADADTATAATIVNSLRVG